MTYDPRLRAELHPAAASRARSHPDRQAQARPDLNPRRAASGSQPIVAVVEHRLRGRRFKWTRRRAQGTPLSQPAQPNDLWCADYKGEFMLADRRYCYPLTVTDFASRYLLACEALSTTQEPYAFKVFERVFQEFGLPQRIRTDNGVPFASTSALYGLSKLSVWWLRLGVQRERITPGHPEQNGRHERMHLTLKREATKPAAANMLQQQDRFDAFLDRYNRERPHVALAMNVPADRYTPSPRPYAGLPHLEYPFHDWSATVTHCGRVCYRGHKVNVSQAFAGQLVGVRQVGEQDSKLDTRRHGGTQS